MNQVLITCPVGHDGETNRVDLRNLRDIAAHVFAAGGGGALVAGMLAEAGTAARGLDPTTKSSVVLACGLLTAALAIGLELRGRVRPLPERRRQVPRGWLIWRRRWLTAAAFGFMLGAGVFTHLRHATMYALGAMVFLAPSIQAAVVVGAAYGANRGATVMYAWLVRRFGSQITVGIGRSAPVLLAVAATALPIWIVSQLSE